MKVKAKPKPRKARVVKPPRLLKPKPVAAFAWMICDYEGEWFLCQWAAPSRKQLYNGGQPSPEARVVRVTLSVRWGRSAGQLVSRNPLDDRPCKECAYFLHPNVRGGGECHRFPPTTFPVPASNAIGVVTYPGVWPRVKFDDTCGEWKDSATIRRNGRGKEAAG